LAEHQDGPLYGRANLSSEAATATTACASIAATRSMAARVQPLAGPGADELDLDIAARLEA